MTTKSSALSTVVGSAIGVGCIAAVCYYFYVEQESQMSNITSMRHENKTAAKPPRAGLRRSLRPKKDYTVEICLSDIQSIRNAISGGCNSIELCTSRIEGGVTPSIGLIEQAVSVIGGRDIALHILIRPRAGGFCYNDDEFDIIQRDIIAAKLAGADGIVFGALDHDEHIDMPRMKLIRELSEGMLLTFHRAFDVCRTEPSTALTQVLELKCDRLLTSGGPQSSVMHNLTALQALQEQGKGRIQIVAAAGVNELNAAQIVHTTGVTSVHAGSAVCVTMPRPPVAISPRSEGSSPSDVGSSSKDDVFGAESFVDVRLPETPKRGATAPSKPGMGQVATAVTGSVAANATGGAGSSSGGSVESAITAAAAQASAVQELMAWQCVDEAAVSRLVALTKAAVVALTSAAVEVPARSVEESGPGGGAEAGAEGYVHV